MEEIKASLKFEVSTWGCRVAVKDLANRLNLEFVYVSEGGGWIFEWISGKVRGNFSDIKTFKRMLEREFGD